MPRGLLPPLWVPQFGTGAPGANVSTAAPYYDKSTNPYTSYVWNAATQTWNKFAVAGVNATQLQGTAVTNSAPADGHPLTLTAGAWV